MTSKTQSQSQEKKSRYSLIKGGKANVEYLFPEFEDHLDDNDRILFSGPFGAGKTIFLEEFFLQKEFNEKYYSIHLFPVAYSVAANDDIYKLIKYDIIAHILEDPNFNVEKIAIPESWLHLTAAKETFKSSWDLVAKGMAKATGLSLIGAEHFIDFAKEFNNKVAELSKSVGKSIHTDMLDFQKSVGLYYESALIEMVIETGLKQISERRSQEEAIQIVEKRKTVLIIDDLDRIDPEHIFRILNVFSSQFDQGTRKLNIDKVVVVCDYDNLRKLYAHRYGEGVDFAGYISKFYNNGIFRFDLKEEVRNYITYTLNPLYKHLGFDSDDKTVLEHIIFTLYDAGCLDLRSIEKLKGEHKIPTKYFRLSLKNVVHPVLTKELRLYNIYKVLHYLFADKVTLLSKLKTAANYRLDNVDYKIKADTDLLLCHYIIPILAYRHHRFTSNEKGYSYQNQRGQRIDFHIEKHHGAYYCHSLVFSGCSINDIFIYEELYESIHIMSNFELLSSGSIFGA